MAGNLQLPLTFACRKMERGHVRSFHIIASSGLGRNGAAWFAPGCWKAPKAAGERGAEWLVARLSAPAHKVE